MMYLASGKERCVVLGLYIVENNTTVRATALRFGISKSTVHKDITQSLKQINKSLYLDVKSVLEKNKEERHLRGGEATKQKYLCNKWFWVENPGFYQKIHKNPYKRVAIHRSVKLYKIKFLYNFTRWNCAKKVRICEIWGLS